MRDFFVELGRTRVFAEAYIQVRRKRKPAENDAQRKKSHFWMETRLSAPFDKGPIDYAQGLRQGR
jgi:hypothetical protein